MRSARAVAAGTLVVLVAGCALLQAPAAGSTLEAAAYLGGLTAAAGLAWLGATSRDPRPAGPRPAARTGLAVGVTLNLLGDVVFQAFDGAPPGAGAVSLADGLWFASLAVVIVSLALWRRADVAAGDHFDTAIDGAAALVVGLVAVWELALEDVWSDPAVTGAARWVLSAYPLADMVVLAMVVRLALLTTRSWALGAVGAGAVVWIVADLDLLADAGTASAALDVAWVVALALVAGGTFPDRSLERSAPPALVDRRRMWLAFAPLAVPLGVVLVGYPAGHRPNAAIVTFAVCALVVVAGLRADRLLRSAERSRQEVADREHLYRALSANGADAVVVSDADGRIREGRFALAKLLRIDADDLDATDAVLAAVVQGREALDSLIDTVAEQPGRMVEHEVEVRLPDGTTRWLQVRVTNMLDDPAVEGIVANVQDVTDRHRAEEELRHAALHDVLTGLPNRDLLVDRIDQAILRSGRSGRVPAVVVLDVDGFKAVNDRYGHDGGDEVITALAERLARVVSPGDTVARLGGDEFGVLVEGDVSEAGRARLAERLATAVGEPVAVAGRSLTVSASLGIAEARPGTTAETVLHEANVAMHQAKAGGKDRTVVYEESMGSAAGEATLLEADLVSAVPGGQLVLEYQPVIDLDDDRLVGFEALLRWEHPRLGRVGPDRFIPLAEQTGLIVPIGRWVLATACEVAARWQGLDRTGGPPLSMAVNLSGRQLASDQVVHDVREALERSGLPPGSLVLEMTETALVADSATAAERLRTLSGLGVRIAIDDFGTGYSSPAYLEMFPIDILKVDRSFTSTITSADAAPPIVRGLLDLGAALGLEVIAEGIEDDHQREVLRLARCDQGQGYLFSRPLPVDQAEQMVVARDRSDAAPVP